jgi:hypothetical protein
LLIFELLQALLGDPANDLLQVSLEMLSLLLLFIAFLWYHGRVLRTDNRMAAQSLAARHAEYPVLVLVRELGAFSDVMVAALEREAPALPVAVHVTNQGAPDETFAGVRAIILPSDVIANPTEAIRLWVQNFTGIRFVVPTPTRGWWWVSGLGKSTGGMIQQTAELVRKLAEGEDISKTRPLSGWAILGYVLGGFVGVILLVVLLSTLADLFL